jgi:hypothetical protein
VVNTEAVAEAAGGNVLRAAADVIVVVVDADNSEIALDNENLVGDERSACADANVEDARATGDALEDGAIPVRGESS